MELRFLTADVRGLTQIKWIEQRYCLCAARISGAV